jgi:hypothetical protein
VSSEVNGPALGLKVIVLVICVEIIKLVQNTRSVTARTGGRTANIRKNETQNAHLFGIKLQIILGLELILKLVCCSHEATRSQVIDNFIESRLRHNNS